MNTRHVIGAVPPQIATVQLVGTDGNAFAVLGKCRRAAKDASWPKEKIQEFLSEAREGDYDHLLEVVEQYFDVE